MEANKPCNSGFSLPFFPLADWRSHFLWFFENPNQPAKFFVWQIFIVDTELLAVKYNELFIPAEMCIRDRHYEHYHWSQDRKDHRSLEPENQPHGQCCDRLLQQNERCAGAFILPMLFALPLIQQLDDSVLHLFWGEAAREILPQGVVFDDHFVPVSYTHLDVYKRQLLHGIQQTMQQRFFFTVFSSGW